MFQKFFCSTLDEDLKKLSTFDDDNHWKADDDHWKVDDVMSMPPRERNQKIAMVQRF